MKKFMTTVVVSGLVVSGAWAEASLTVDFATAYVFRGQTQVDELVMQPGLELSGFGMDEKYGEITVGAWASTAPFEDNYDNFHETDWYVSYTLPQFTEGLDLYISWTEYMYTAPVGEKELGIGAGYALGDFMLGGSANFMMDSENLATESQAYFDLYADYEFDISEQFDLAAGGLLSVILQGDGYSVVRDDGLNHYELYANAGYALGEMWSLGASLTYYGRFSSDVLPDSVGALTGYDKGLVLMFGVGCDL